MEKQMNFSNISVHNIYTLTLRNKNNQIKQQAVFTNTLCKNFFYDFFGYGDPWYFFGEGTEPPKWEDTQLSNYLWQGKATKISEGVTEDNLGYYVISKASIPATSEYTGKITEIGFGRNYTRVATHALVVDAEGNPIEINKTEFDSLEITMRMEVRATVPNYIVSTAVDLSRLICYGCFSSRESRYSIRSLYLYSKDFNKSPLIGPESNPGNDYKFIEFYNGGKTSVSEDGHQLIVSFDKKRGTFKDLSLASYATHIQIGDYWNGFWVGPIINIKKAKVIPPFEIPVRELKPINSERTMFMYPFSYFIEDSLQVKTSSKTLVKNTDYSISSLDQSFIYFNQMQLPKIKYTFSKGSTNFPTQPQEDIIAEFPEHGLPFTGIFLFWEGLDMEVYYSDTKDPYNWQLYKSLKPGDKGQSYGMPSSYHPNFRKPCLIPLDAPKMSRYWKFHPTYSNEIIKCPCGPCTIGRIIKLETPLPQDESLYASSQCDLPVIHNDFVVDAQFVYSLSAT